MIYLSGRKHKINDRRVGVLHTMNSESLPCYDRPWAADNGRFTAPHIYSDDRYLAWLSKHDSAGCLFATATDVVGDHVATVKLSALLLPRLRSAGYKSAFVAQDGFDGASTPWDDFDCLFIGGTDKFKLGERIPDIVAEARERRKWIHMGRVNSYKRLRLAKLIGCDSADGTFLRFAPNQNTGRLLRWLDKIDNQFLMELVT